MLIDANETKQILDKYKVSVKGVFHIGAHDCEELPFYFNTLCITPDKCVWIDALEDQVDKVTSFGIPNVFQGVVTDKDDEEVIFNVTNNKQSSSVLQFGTHEKHHDWVHFTHTLKLKTITIDTFFSRNNLNPENYDFWNLDIQGAELMALRGGQNALKYVKVIYLEVNKEEVYKGCGLIEDIDKFLFTHGFIRVETCFTEHGWGDAIYIKIN